MPMPDAKPKYVPFVPAEVFPPGEFVDDEIEYRGMSRDILAECMRVPRETVDKLIAGEIRLDMRLAGELERALGISAYSWLSLERYYRKYLPMIKERDNA